MVQDQAFAELFGRVKEGDSEAMSELVRLYEPEVRLAVRMMLTNAALRSQFDSADVSQSVLLRFCLKAREGKFELATPQQLVALLKKIAYNRFLNRLEYAEAQERDFRRVEGHDQRLGELFGRNAGPCTIAGWRDEHEQICRRFTDEEQELAERWAAGEAWNEIAGPERTNQDRLRHKLSAAFSRVAGQLSQLRSEPVSADYLKAVFQWAVEQLETEKESEHESTSD